MNWDCLCFHRIDSCATVSRILSSPAPSRIHLPWCHSCVPATPPSLSTSQALLPSPYEISILTHKSSLHSPAAVLLPPSCSTPPVWVRPHVFCSLPPSCDCFEWVLDRNTLDYVCTIGHPNSVSSISLSTRIFAWLPIPHTSCEQAPHPVASCFQPIFSAGLPPHISFCSPQRCGAYSALILYPERPDEPTAFSSPPPPYTAVRVPFPRPS